MIRATLLFFLVSICAGSMTAQQRLPVNSNIYNAGSRGIIYDKELSFSLSVASPRNFVVGARSGKLVSFDKMKYWSLSAGNIRHSRERRINPEDFNPLTKRISRSYTYGKQNNLYALRFGFGTRKYISEKAREKGVAIGYSYEFGPTLGILKPYYLEYKVGDGSFNTLDIRYTEDNLDQFLAQENIFGASTWSTGLDEITLRPGIHAKLATHFGFGAYDEMAKYLEAGIMGDFFLGETDLLVESESTPGVSNSPLFLSLYVKLGFGKRW